MANPTAKFFPAIFRNLSVYLRPALALIALAIFATSGCATAPPLDFVPADIAPAEIKIDAEVQNINVAAATVALQGSVFNNPGVLGTHAVGNKEDFKTVLKTAIGQALARSRVFSDSSDCKVLLSARVLKLYTPPAAWDFDAETRIRYELVNQNDGERLFSKEITSRAKVPFDHAFAGYVRAMEARNRSIQNNIEQFIAALKDAKGCKSAS